MTPDEAARILRDRFRSRNPGAPPRIGVEVEFICVDRESGRPAPPLEPGPATVPAVAELAASRRWTCMDGRGLPAFVRPDGTVVSWEPGGQLEVATPPLESLDAVDAALRTTIHDLVGALDPRGVALLARGLDPLTPVDVPELWLDHPRYRRMSAHYDRGGPAGRRMMRQTAAVHVNLDFGERPLERWTRANLAIPAATAVFANSRRVEGRPGWRSERARTWRTLDASRTGAFGRSSDPVGDYLAFARSAHAFLTGPEDEPARSWSEIEHAAHPDDWRAHLTTLFPEVRPRGYLEVRSIDALGPEHVTVAAAFVAGIVYGAAPVPVVPDPTRERLETAARDGVGSAAVRREALAWWEVALDGLASVGPGFASPRILRRAADFRREFTERGRDPGDDTREWIDRASLDTAV